MTKLKAAQKDRPDVEATTSDVIEKKLVAFAEQLGVLIGTVQTKAEGWLDRTALTEEIGRIRDSAADLLAHVKGGYASQRNTASKPPAAPAPGGSRGPVDAPGKRHRKPVPDEWIDKRMGEPRGKQMGQKSAKSGKRGGRS
jgi:hypothetical protein